MRRFLPASAVIAGLALLPGAAPAETPRRGGILQVGVTAEPNTTDCHASATFATLHHVHPHYSFLVKVSAETYPEIVGDLAQSWEISPDKLTYTFKLHPDVKFHDGSPLTSADVAASYERIRNPPAGISSPRKNWYSEVAAIETPDPATVVFRLSRADPAMLEFFASPWNCIYSAALLKADPRSPEKTVMGSGPFKFVERVSGSHWVGTRFDGYFKPGLPYLDGFRNILMTSTSLINALQGGQVHADFRGITPPERDRLKAAMGDRITIQEASMLNNLLMSFNVERKPFDDARVRRALALAVDHWKMGEVLGRTTQLTGTGALLRPGAAIARTNAELEELAGFGRDMAKNRAEAKRLLQEAGQSNLKFSFVNRSIAEPYQPLAIFLIDQWRQIGVTAQQQPLETAPYFNALSSGNLDAGIDFTTDYLDEPTIQWFKFLSLDKAPNNSSRFTDRTVDDLYEQQKQETDPVKRKALVRQFEQRIVSDEAYWLPLLWFGRIIAHSSQMKGWPITPSYQVNQDLATVWLAP